MAENEYLVSSGSRHWRSAVLALQTGRDPVELQGRLEKCFLKELNLIRQELPFPRMIQLVERPGELKTLLATIEGGENVKDFLVQEAEKGGGSERILRRFLRSALNNCLYDLPYIAASGTAGIGISSCRSVLNMVASEMGSDLDRIAAKLAKNPEWKPKRRSRPRDQALIKSHGSDQSRSPVSPDDATSKMLGESIVGGHVG